MEVEKGYGGGNDGLRRGKKEKMVKGKGMELGGKKMDSSEEVGYDSLKVVTKGGAVEREQLLG